MSYFEYTQRDINEAYRFGHEQGVKDAMSEISRQYEETVSDREAQINDLETELIENGKRAEEADKILSEVIYEISLLTEVPLYQLDTAIEAIIDRVKAAREAL